MIPRLDPEAVTTAIQEVAAAEIVPRFRKLTAEDITPKGRKGDFATSADFASEKALSERLSRLLPGSRIVGEEGCEKQPDLLEIIAGEAPTWIIDPLDGTHNFAKGIPQFAVIVALARAGETVAAWIHDPLGNATITAEQGGGAWEAGKRLAVATPRSFWDMSGSLYVAAGKPGISPRLDDARARFAHVINYRCAGHDYLSLARGSSHFALFSRLMPWDHAAGALIHAEAGGYNRCWDGAPYRPTRHSGGLLLAPDAATWTAIADLVFARPTEAAPLSSDRG